MPGPPPNGRASTVRWLSVAKSRGLQVFTSSNPRSCALPTTPIPAQESMNSGNSVMTSMRIARVQSIRFLELRIPVDRDPAGGEIHSLHIIIKHEGQQPLTLAIADHHHIVGTGAEQMRNPTQRHTFNGDNLESFEVGPVILVSLRILQGRSPDLDLASDQARCTIPVGDFRQACNDSLALLPALA